MVRSELIRIARELHTVHGLMPVPVAGKVPIGGTGWNLQSLETRMQFIDSDECTGLGIQMGLVFHPVHGPIEVRCIDCDIDDRQKSMLFAATLCSFIPVTQWRWGRRPATLIFTQPGMITSEKFGPIQLLGNGKQEVWLGLYRNKSPLSTDPPEYWHEGPSILDLSPPLVPAAILKQALEASVVAAGYQLYTRSLVNAAPLSTADLEMLNADSIAHFQNLISAALLDVSHSPSGSGRGDKLYRIGIKYGALIKASGTALALCEAAHEMTSYVEFDVIKKHAFLQDIGRIAEEAFAVLPGTLGHGDRRDFARGVALSRGHGQQIAVANAKTPMLMPSGRGHPAQRGGDLMAENLAPLRFLVTKFFTDTGCVVFAGKPKIGKGWIVLELGMSIAEGGKFWNEQCIQGEVLLYMMEDSKRRVQERVKILRPFDFPSINNMMFRYSPDGPFFVNADGSGTLLDDIREHMRCFPRIRLIIIDVLQRVRGPSSKVDNAYERDYKIVGAIQKLAAELSVLILVVHHVKKGKVDDAIDSISGSFGISAAADGAFTISKNGDVVRVESWMRDTLNFEFELIKEGSNPMWKPAQTITELFAPSEGTKTQSVLTALRDAACALTAGDIARRTGVSESNVATYLGRLMKSFQINRPSRGLYMANGLPYRERMEGIIDTLKRCPRVTATNEVKAQYAPNFDLPLDVRYMVLTDVALREIDANFVGGKEVLQKLKYRGLIDFNSDTLWLVGDGWETKQPELMTNPFAFKYPWEQ